jgi:hypothetical protein
VAREAGKNNDILAVLGTVIAVKAFRDGTLPFPDETMIARLTYLYKSSPEIDAVIPADQGTSCSATTRYSDSIDQIIQWRQQ